MIFEYMLPLERYRRPDVILLFNEKVIILEFKEKYKIEVRDVEQAIGYREDIKHFLLLLSYKVKKRLREA